MYCQRVWEDVYEGGKGCFEGRLIECGDVVMLCRICIARQASICTSSDVYEFV